MQKKQGSRSARDGIVGEQVFVANMLKLRTPWKGTAPRTPACGSETEWAVGWADPASEAGGRRGATSPKHPGCFPLQTCLLSPSFTLGHFCAIPQLPSNTSPFLLTRARGGFHGNPKNFY